MQIADTDRFIRTAQARALVALPSLLLLMFVLHFRTPANFLTFRLSYEPRPPEDAVRGMIAMGHMPLIHDPHIIGYLSLPLFSLCAFGLYALGRQVRPVIATAGLALTITGTIYLGGLLGLWTAIIHGIGDVDPKFLDGATATFAAETAPQGAFWLTTSLAKLALIGFAVQILALWPIRDLAKWAVSVATLGCLLIIVFWDLDNWMLIGAALMLAGFIPIRSRLQPDVRTT
jgi:hypothetical protein